MNDLLPFRDLNDGAVFFIDRCYGITYQKTGKHTMEFVHHPSYPGLHGHTVPALSTEPVRRSALGSKREARKAAKATDSRMFCWKADPIYADMSLEELRDLVTPKRTPASLEADLVGDFPTPVRKARKRSTADAIASLI